jgi:hypothetical protein
MHPEIQDTLAKTWTWMHEKHFAQYASLDAQTQTRLMLSAESRALALDIDIHAMAEDVNGTKAACRAYLRHWREVLKAQETSSKEQKTVVE